MGQVPCAHTPKPPLQLGLPGLEDHTFCLLTSNSSFGQHREIRPTSKESRGYGHAATDLFTEVPIDMTLTQMVVGDPGGIGLLSEVRCEGRAKNHRRTAQEAGPIFSGNTVSYKGPRDVHQQHSEETRATATRWCRPR